MIPNFLKSKLTAGVHVWKEGLLMIIDSLYISSFTSLLFDVRDG